MAELIERAAIWHGAKIFSLPRPNRHHDVIHYMAACGYGPECTRRQGFTTSEGRFVDREEAACIAKAAGQIKTKTGPDDLLFSEDVW